MNQEGFSLIELLIVVAIIGVVSAIAMPNLLNARKAAYEANAVRYLKTWLPGQEMYKKVNGNYATNDEDLVTGNFISKSLNSGGNDTVAPARCSSNNSVATCVSDSIINTPGIKGAPGKWP